MCFENIKNCFVNKIFRFFHCNKEKTNNLIPEKRGWLLSRAIGNCAKEGHCMKKIKDNSDCLFFFALCKCVS